MYSNQEWSPNSRKISTFIDLKPRKQENKKQYVFKGGIFKCTYNQDGVFSHSKLALCYDVPKQIDPDRFQRIKMLVPPPTIKYDTFIFNPELPKDHYIQIGFKDVSIVQP